MIPKHVLVGLNAVGIAGLVWVLADTGMKVSDYTRPASVPDDAPSAPGQRKAPRPNAMREIVRAHLFGKQYQAAAPKPVTVTNTRLNLILTGIIAGPDPAMARAIIAAGSGRAETYKIGDVVARSDAKLYEIQGESVLLERRGKLERLEMRRLALTGNAAQAVGTSPAPAPDAAAEEVSALLSQDESGLPQPSAPLETPGSAAQSQTGQTGEPEAPSPDGDDSEPASPFTRTLPSRSGAGAASGSGQGTDTAPARDPGRRLPKLPVPVF